MGLPHPPRRSRSRLRAAVPAVPPGGERRSDGPPRGECARSMPARVRVSLAAWSPWRCSRSPGPAAGRRSGEIRSERWAGPRRRALPPRRSRRARPSPAPTAARGTAPTAARGTAPTAARGTAPSSPAQGRPAGGHPPGIDRCGPPPARARHRAEPAHARSRTPRRRAGMPDPAPGRRSGRSGPARHAGRANRGAVARLCPQRPCPCRSRWFADHPSPRARRPLLCSDAVPSPWRGTITT